MSLKATGRNPVLVVQQNPHWAALTRMAGDRAAILFEELRAAIGRIDGLREDLVHRPAEAGEGSASTWTPRYRLGDRELFRARLTPGRLEVRLGLDEAACHRLLSAPRLSAEIREALGKARTGPGGREIRLHLSSRAKVRGFAHVVTRLSKT